MLAVFDHALAKGPEALKDPDMHLAPSSARKDGLFSVVDDIFCLFQGHIENIAPLKQQYGPSKTADEVRIEAYRTLWDRCPYPADHVVRDFKGKFTFILYDSTSIPFYRGVDSNNDLVLSDDEAIAKKASGKSPA
ncbi:hypothetical protein BUALT_Bualt02G0214400 [Buddleja alternifolia]|uniref:DUF3700 domain-containing protein n=1 Tax=Buddleja alternifolia TaxID=168488 RepID=A0AAV6YD62_9LAMI|nr:hypothetical protein BUALT_Bualt02G0214400 [Buddleja alternifolia]